MTPPPPAVQASSEVIHGFANHVPLAVALRQILPPGYGFSVDQDVDLGVLVSFKGGRPWQETLSAALEPAGLIVREHGQMVEIGYATSVSKAAPAQMSPPPAIAVDYSAGLPTAPAGQSWNAEPGDSLHKVLETWARRANVEFNWMAEYDYPLQASAHFTGTFEDAVRNLLTGFETAHPQPIAELHSNSKAGQMVLVVTTRGNSSD